MEYIGSIGDQSSSRVCNKRMQSNKVPATRHFDADAGRYAVGPKFDERV